MIYFKDAFAKIDDVSIARANSTIENADASIEVEGILVGVVNAAKAVKAVTPSFKAFFAHDPIVISESATRCEYFGAAI